MTAGKNMRVKCTDSHIHAHTFGNLDNSHYNDKNKGQQLPHSENILDPCPPAHTGAVHPSQEHCK